MRFYFDDAGVFSGGGQAVLANCHFAAERHPIMQGSAASGDAPFFMRNVPPAGERRGRRYVWGPQNALPWSGRAVGLKERLIVTRLRVASEVFGRRAAAQFRTSSVIPVLNKVCSPVLHNVLDPGFDDAATSSVDSTFEPAVGRIVSIGSGHSYRNLAGLLDGYARYRQEGGRSGLFIGGTAGSGRAQEIVRQRVATLPDVVVRWGGMPRPQFLATLRDAAVVVLPSLVEASPLTPLEACAMTPRVVMSDIVAHHEVLAPFGDAAETGQAAFFDTRNVSSLARALRDAEAGGAATTWHHQLSSAERRTQAREAWAQTLADWLSSVADEKVARA